MELYFSFQRSIASSKEVSEAVWSEAEMGPKIAGKLLSNQWDYSQACICMSVLLNFQMLLSYWTLMRSSFLFFLHLPIIPRFVRQKPRDSSVEVRSDWEVKEEMDFPRLMKMRYLEVSEPQDM